MPKNKDGNNSDSSTEGLEDEEVPDDEVDDESKDESGEDESSKANKKAAETRINELSGKLKESETRIRELEAKETKTPMPPATNPANDPKAQQAIQYLEGLGFSRKGAIEEQFKQVNDRIELNSEHTRLNTEYDGEDGRPKYDKSKIEQYMRERAIFDPEVAYKAMNEAELLDWNLKKANTSEKKRPYVEKPGGSGVSRSGETQITKEKLQEVAKNPTPANRDWYERNRNKILQMMQEGQL